MGERIEIVPYRNTWPEEYTALEQEIRAALGPLALSVDHIGSTSVPGLSAKDVIDLQVTVADLQLPVEEALAAIGYRRLPHITQDHQPPGRTDLTTADLAKQFYKYSKRNVNLHVRQHGNFNQHYPLLCRDYLRSHPFAARAYEEIKQQLAKYFPDNVDAYYDIKDPVFDIIMEGAYEWQKNQHTPEISRK
ncbi:GrpB family protein [Chitinophaga sp. Mgbs1]|uniref:GrpB family protein n=1 Tax=Chitinophaga solisilvae TaxID=1233460 RepID=A0A3S1BIK2_9BACT|nr:GrpB family protein [Chitinophaga solisilvae]